MSKRWSLARKTYSLYGCVFVLFKELNSCCAYMFWYLRAWNYCWLFKWNALSFIAISKHNIWYTVLLWQGTIWSIIVYFMTGMDTKGGGRHFFVYYIIIILTVLNGASMVRCISFSAPDMDKAGLVVGMCNDQIYIFAKSCFWHLATPITLTAERLSLLQLTNLQISPGLLVTMFILFAGFLLPRLEVPKYWLWMYYMDPIQWGITALLINQFNSDSYSQLCGDVTDRTNIPQCIGRDNQTIGHAFLARGQFYTSNSWIAVAILVLCGWLVLWNFLTYLALSRIQYKKILRSGKSTKAEVGAYFWICEWLFTWDHEKYVKKPRISFFCRIR